MVFLNRGDHFEARPLPLEAQFAPAFGLTVADFDGDGDLDLLCGEFLDGFTYFENTGSRTRPRYAAGQRLVTSGGEPLAMDLEMIVPGKTITKHIEILGIIEHTVYHTGQISLLKKAKFKN